MQANPELTGAEIFRAFQRRFPSRYRPTHLRTLQRGVHHIRTRLRERDGESWPSAALPEGVPADPLILRREEEREPPSHALPAVSAALASETADAGLAPCSFPPEQGTRRALELVADAEDGQIAREGKKRRRVSHVPRPSAAASAFVAPMTVEHAIQLYLQDLVAKERSPKTVEWHRTALGLLQEYLQQTYPQVSLTHLTRREMRGWVAWLRAEPGATGMQRSANTVNTYMRSARAFGAFLVQQGYLESSPFGAIALPKAKKPRIYLVEQETFDQVLLACQPPGESSALRTEASARNRALLWVLLETGLLVSEVCALRLVDVDRKRGQLRVRGKGSRKRQVLLGPGSQHALRAYLDQYRLKVHRHTGEDPLFLTETGRPLTPNTITLLLNRLSRRAGLTGTCISPSMLRDTFAVRFLQAGGEPHTLHERLGVENWETIKRYQQVSDQQGKEQKRGEIQVPSLS